MRMVTAVPAAILMPLHLEPPDMVSDVDPCHEFGLGEFREVPYEKLYEPINMTFYVDNDMQVKKLFDEWMSLISDPSTRTYNYYNNYNNRDVQTCRRRDSGKDRCGACNN